MLLSSLHQDRVHGGCGPFDPFGGCDAALQPQLRIYVPGVGAGVKWREAG